MTSQATLPRHRGKLPTIGETGAGVHLAHCRLLPRGPAARASQSRVNTELETKGETPMTQTKSAA
ncbi:MAG: hypothetical protein AAGF20_00405, partial [Pseudomonadota bacterium]